MGEKLEWEGMKTGAKTHQWRRRCRLSRWSKQRQTESASSCRGRPTGPPAHFPTASPWLAWQISGLLDLLRSHFLRALHYGGRAVAIARWERVTRPNANDSCTISAFSSSHVAIPAAITFSLGSRDGRALRRPCTPARRHSSYLHSRSHLPSWNRRTRSFRAQCPIRRSFLLCRLTHNMLTKVRSLCNL